MKLIKKILILNFILITAGSLNAGNLFSECCRQKKASIETNNIKTNSTLWPPAGVTLIDDINIETTDEENMSTKSSRNNSSQDLDSPTISKEATQFLEQLTGQPQSKSYPATRRSSKSLETYIRKTRSSDNLRTLTDEEIKECKSFLRSFGL